MKTMIFQLENVAFNWKRETQSARNDLAAYMQQDEVKMRHAETADDKNGFKIVC